MSSNQQEKQDEPMAKAFGDWRLLNIYRHGSSCSRTITRSQSAFNRIANTPSDLELFANKDKHNPPDKPHLMETLKGMYGAIPNTVVTRSFSKFLSVSKDLCNAVDAYKQGGMPEATSSVGKDEETVAKEESSEKEDSSSTVTEESAQKEEEFVAAEEGPEETQETTEEEESDDKKRGSLFGLMF